MLAFRVFRNEKMTCHFFRFFLFSFFFRVVSVFRDQKINAFDLSDRNTRWDRACAYSASQSTRDSLLYWD